MRVRYVREAADKRTGQDGIYIDVDARKHVDVERLSGGCVREDVGLETLDGVVEVGRGHVGHKGEASSVDRDVGGAVGEGLRKRPDEGESVVGLWNGFLNVEDNRLLVDHIGKARFCQKQ